MIFDLNRSQKQNPFNQLLMPFIQLVIAVVCVWLSWKAFARFLWLIGELQLVVFFVGAWVAFHNQKTGAGATLSLVGVYAFVSHFLWEIDYIPAFAVWTEARIGQTVITFIFPIFTYYFIKRMITDMRFPNLVDSVNALRGRLRQGIASDDIETPDEPEPERGAFRFGG